MPLLPAVPYDSEILAATLTDYGACVLTGLPAPDITSALRDRLRELADAQALKAAEIGRGQGLMYRAELRGDSTRWLDATSSEPEAAYLSLLEFVRTELNQRLFLGLAEVEAHFSCYPPGAFFVRHRDRFRDHDARVVSVVSYLNQGWLPEQGGALRIYLPDGHADVVPEEGTTICFMSELEHEVLPANRQRLSIAAWMRRRSR